MTSGTEGDDMKLRVMMDGREVGRLRKESAGYYFAYSREWLEEGFSISPHSLPLEDRLFVGSNDRFDGLLGVFADSLPGEWGMLTAVKALRNKGVDHLSLDSLEKLAYLDEGASGSLYYEPCECDWDVLPMEDLDRLCGECMSLIEDDSNNLDEVFRRAGSTGGARPKMNLRIDGGDWIVKFRERNDPAWIGRMEYEYNRAAEACGIDVPEYRLMHSEQCNGYFASKRFDRRSGKRLHMISLGGLLEVPSSMPLLDYISFLQATRFVTQSQEEVVKAFRLSCFNILAKNFDDHSANFSYLYLPEKGGYVLSPAYDLTRTPNMTEHHMTCMGNPLPERKELEMLAAEMHIPKRRAAEIIDHVRDVISDMLGEWIQK